MSLEDFDSLEGVSSNERMTEMLPHALLGRLDVVIPGGLVHLER